MLCLKIVLITVIKINFKIKIIFRQYQIIFISLRETTAIIVQWRSSIY